MPALHIDNARAYTISLGKTCGGEQRRSASVLPEGYEFLARAFEPIARRQQDVFSLWRRAARPMCPGRILRFSCRRRSCPSWDTSAYSRPDMTAGRVRDGHGGTLSPGVWAGHVQAGHTAGISLRVTARLGRTPSGLAGHRDDGTRWHGPSPRRDGPPPQAFPKIILPDNCGY